MSEEEVERRSLEDLKAVLQEAQGEALRLLTGEGQNSSRALPLHRAISN